MHDFDYRNDIPASTATWFAKPGVPVKDSNNGDSRFYVDFRNAWVDPNWCGWSCGRNTYNGPTLAWMWALHHTY